MFIKKEVKDTDVQNNKYIYLDNTQREIVLTKIINTLVVACPGAGKTTVIINRVNHLIEDRKILLGNIIVLTFTRAAAENMKSRYKNKFNKDIAPFFGTFHGLFYKILLREGYSINILEGGKAHGLIKNVLAKYFDDVNDDKVREVLNNISLFKTSLDDLEKFKPSISKEIFEECLNYYEGYKEKEKLWDFDDLSVKALSLFIDNRDVLNRYKRIFKYVLVDEFQDCDELQVKFLKLINEGNQLFAVGDEDQCIYSFRGSKPEYMVKFNENFKDGKKVYLSTNYRSKENIVDISKKIINYNISRNDKKILAASKELGIIKLLKPYNEYIQGDEISKIIKESKYDEYKNNAVLYRTNMEARSIIDTFSRNKIPFVLLDKGYNFFEHFICKDIINYLKLSVNINDKAAFATIINKPFRYVSKNNISYVKSYVEYKDPFQILIDKSDIAPFQCKKLDELRKEVLYLNKISLGSAIQYIVSSLGYIDYVREYANKYNQSFSDLEDVIEEFKASADGYKTINEFLVHIENVKEQIEKSAAVHDGVILSTIHGVKGMEFKSVFIINADEETIPHKSSMDENIEEERRLFYVAVTRAIQNLYVFCPKTIRGKFNEPSRFVLEGEFEGESAKVDYGLEVKDVIYHRTYGEGKVISINGDAIKIYFKDGLERSFSLKVLMENGLIIIMR